MITLWDAQDAAQTAALSSLLGEYLLATEREKGDSVASVEGLPARYLAEVGDPEASLAASSVFLRSTGDDAMVGCAVLTAPFDGVAEIKRLWVRPEERGQGHARALLDACIVASESRGDAALRLTVWDWRGAAITLYRSVGFEPVESWDHRAGLVCMERPLEGATARSLRGTGGA